jgi:hypothetical protein
LVLCMLLRKCQTIPTSKGMDYMWNKAYNDKE